MEVALSIAGLVLAAGRGRRIGGPKALLRHGDALLVEHALRMVRDAGCDPLVVILGAAADEVRAAADLGDATVVVNKAWGTGVGSSLRVGLVHRGGVGCRSRGRRSRGHAGTDRRSSPGGSPPGPHPDALACATFDGRRGHPMLIGRSHFAGISTLANGDVGIRPYLLARAAQVTEIPCDEVATPGDVDTPEDAARWGSSCPDDARRRVRNQAADAWRAVLPPPTMLGTGSRWPHAADRRRRSRFTDPRPQLAQVRVDPGQDVAHWGDRRVGRRRRTGPRSHGHTVPWW